MPRESCLYDRPLSRYVTIHEDHIKLCEGSPCAAAILSCLAEETDHLMNIMELEGKRRLVPWLYFDSLAQIQERILSLYGTASIAAGIEVLEQVGAIEKDGACLRVRVNEINAKLGYLKSLPVSDAK